MTLNELVKALRELTQAGFKEDEKGRKWLWRGYPSEIKERLISFFKKWSDVNELYNSEDIINAYKQYLEDTKNPDGTPHKYRKLLKYFIWKEEKGEKTSLLMKYLEAPEEASAEIRSLCNTIAINNNQESGNQSESWIDTLL